MRLPNAAHESRQWLISQIAPEFELLDAWALPVSGAADELGRLIDVVRTLDPTRDGPLAARALFALRSRLGEIFGWDEQDGALPIPGSADTRLSARVPAELRDTVTRPIDVASSTFVPIYRTDDEWAAEISNKTVHGVLQLTWLDRGDGIYDGRLAVYVKPRGKLGVAYLAAIGPFRHAIVYPALLRQIERAWNAGDATGGR